LTYNGPVDTCATGTDPDETLRLCQNSSDGFTIVQVSQSAAGVCPTGEFSFTDITGVSGTVTQGSTTVPVDLSTADHGSPVVEWFMPSFDVNNGAVTFDLSTLTFGSGTTCA
jgi:hypothetical protein